MLVSLVRSIVNVLDLQMFRVFLRTCAGARFAVTITPGTLRWAAAWLHHVQCSNALTAQHHRNRGSLPSSGGLCYSQTNNSSMQVHSGQLIKVQWFPYSRSMSAFNNSHGHKHVDRYNMGWAILDGLQIMTFTWIFLLIKIYFILYNKKIQLFASGNLLINKTKEF